MGSSVQEPGLDPADDSSHTHTAPNSSVGDHEKAALDKPDIGPAPEGGARAWMVTAGGAMILFCTMGFSNSFGTFEQYYLEHQLKGESESKVAWIGSLSLFLQFFAGMVGGPLFDRFGAKVIRPAAIVYAFSMMMLSLCKTYWQIMLVQGVLMGIVMGFLQFPAFAAASQYFDKNRAAALGIVISGSSIGGIVIPIALSKMLNESSLGFGWSVRVIGFLILPFMLFSCVAIKERLPPRKTAFFLFSAYKEPRFVIIIAAFFFMFFGMLTPMFYLPIYATTRGMDATLAGYLLSILNGASTFGRIIPGALADKYGRINMFGFGGMVTGVIIFCMSSVTSNASLIVYAIFVGFASGTIISGGSAALSVCARDAHSIGTYMGMGMAVAGLGGLIGPPVNGAIVAAYKGYFEVCMVSGSLCVFGAMVAFSAKLFTPGGILGRE